MILTIATKAKGRADRENETEGTTVPELKKIFSKKFSVRFRETLFLLLFYFFRLKNAGTAPQSSSSVLIVGMDFLSSSVFFESNFEKLL